MAKPALADDFYFIELGKVKTLQEADDKWQELLDAHTALLSDLQRHSREVIHEGRHSFIHIYAGPIEDKADAQKICKQLFRDQIACFVVEGLPAQSNKGESTAVSGAVLPWLAEEEKKRADEQKQAALLPWMVSSQAPELGDGEVQETKIEVAEAVRVPLSDRDVSNRMTTASVGKYWVIVKSFQKQRDAVDYWKKAREQALNMTVGLRTVIRRSAGEDQFALLVGPLSSHSDASYLCSMALLPVDSTLSCDVKEDGSARTRLARSEASSRDEPQTENPTAASHSASYWLQIPLSDASEEGDKAWKSMLSEHGDLLEGVDYLGLASSKRGNAIRFGNFANRDEAAQLCYQLKQRQLKCQVFGGL